MSSIQGSVLPAGSPFPRLVTACWRRFVSARGIDRRSLELEDQRLDGDRHGAGGLEDAPDIDEIEIPKRNAIDGQDLVRQLTFLLERGSDGTADIAVKHEDHRTVSGQGPRNGLDEAGQEGIDPLERGIALPLEHESDVLGALLQI